MDHGALGADTKEEELHTKAEILNVHHAQIAAI
jgi:hypothetical protein